MTQYLVRKKAIAVKTASADEIEKKREALNRCRQAKAQLQELQWQRGYSIVREKHIATLSSAIRRLSAY